MSTFQKIIKRQFDFWVALTGLLVIGWLILPAALIAKYDTKISGLFFQKRVGLNGKLFNVIKIRTMRHIDGFTSYITIDRDPRISRAGNFFRKSKIDELPQLWNVLVGNMSFVGPRPDLPGFADELRGDDRIILTIRPGITSPASLKYKEEEVLLAGVEDPVYFNKEVIYPDKVRINKEYIRNYSFGKDIYYILKTVFG